MLAGELINDLSPVTSRGLTSKTALVQFASKYWKTNSKQIQLDKLYEAFFPSSGVDTSASGNGTLVCVGPSKNPACARPVLNDTLIWISHETEKKSKRGKWGAVETSTVRSNFPFKVRTQVCRSLRSLSISVDPVIDGPDSISRPYQRAAIDRLCAWPWTSCLPNLQKAFKASAPFAVFPQWEFPLKLFVPDSHVALGQMWCYAGFLAYLASRRAVPCSTTWPSLQYGTLKQDKHEPKTVIFSSQIRSGPTFLEPS